MAVQTLENELKIDNASPKLYIDALNTLPIAPRFGKLAFAAAGLNRPLTKDGEEGLARYLSECASKGIMPFTKLQFEYAHEVGTFVPVSGSYSSDKIVEIYQDQSPELIRAKLEGLLSGGKIQDMNYEFRSSESFEKFRKNELISLLSHGYLPREGDLWLSDSYSSGSCSGGISGYDPRSTLRFNTLSQSGPSLKLTLDEDDDSALEPKLREWFNRLTITHQPK